MSYYPPLDEDSASINSSSEDVPTGLGFGIMDQVMADVESDADTFTGNESRPPSYNPHATVHAVSHGHVNPNQVVVDLRSPEKSKRPPRPPPPKKPNLGTASRVGKGNESKDEVRVVANLTVPQVRWFYKDDTTKKWLPFIGYDSCQLEYKYRQIYVHDDVPDEIERISVRGGLFEVDIVEKKCYAIYWEGEAKFCIQKIHACHCSLHNR